MVFSVSIHPSRLGSRKCGTLKARDWESLLWHGGVGSIIRPIRKTRSSSCRDLTTGRLDPLVGDRQVKLPWLFETMQAVSPGPVTRVSERGRRAKVVISADWRDVECRMVMMVVPS